MRRSDACSVALSEALHWCYSLKRSLRRFDCAFAAAYGLTSTVGLVDDVIDRQHLTIAHVHELAERGLEPQTTWVRDGTLNESRRVTA